MYYVYKGFYVFDFIAHCSATFNALRALLSSHIMTNKDDDDDDSVIGGCSLLEYNLGGVRTTIRLLSHATFLFHLSIRLLKLWFHVQ